MPEDVLVQLEIPWVRCALAWGQLLGALTGLVMALVVIYKTLKGGRDAAVWLCRKVVPPPEPEPELSQLAATMIADLDESGRVVHWDHDDDVVETSALRVWLKGDRIELYAPDHTQPSGMLTERVDNDGELSEFDCKRVREKALEVAGKARAQERRERTQQRLHLVTSRRRYC